MNDRGWIYPYLKENIRLLLFVVFFGLLTVFSAAFLMFTSGFLISKAATRPENLLMIYVPIVAVRAFGITRAVSRYIERLIGHDMVLKILSKMRIKVYQLIEPRVLSSNLSFKTGDVLGMLAEDIERLQDIYLKTVFPSLVGLFLYVLSVLALGFFSWPFAFIMAVHAGVLLFLFPFVSLLVTKANVQRMKAERHGLYERLTDAVMGLSDWQFSGRQTDFISEYEQEEEELSRIEQKHIRFMRWRDSFAQVVVATLFVSMLFWTANESASGNLSHTLIAAFVLVLFPLTETFLPLSDAISEVPAYQDSVDRLSRLSTERIEKQDLNDYVLEKVNRAEGVTLKLENVSFRYDSHHKTLDRLSFSIKQGEKVALLGPSGSGKSTILKLIEGGISPTEGAVTINGVETTTIGSTISNWVAVLNQQPHLFDTTIINNIRLGKRNATDEEVYWAAKQVKLHDYIDSLPDGYETHMHETGMRLSGGQRQRIALARILLQDAPVVILDEPTVGLDPVTENDLLQTIFAVLQDKTVLWITHHLAFVHLTDQVLFLDKGTIQLQGTHQQLMNESERYARFYQLDRPFHL
ncbi:thiol reductant ABC exporter subunit CydC [Bacillus sp. FJAT-47783]|uniref:thiol reductant ABC exporter subunit CydC n=1 Tax=Bacillus sp. FJAT-47783 TaxID=2922712 RepID=UPI001FAB57FE|nr:thiol reductant ABC exporter subunit CydC [Bacillus sp. FJAT-47783]